MQNELNNSDSEIDDLLDVYSEDIKEVEIKDKAQIEADYEKITSTKMKDFKKDDDLSAGLEDLDLGDLDNED
ncbi:Uncharacterised protein [Mycoplasmopsis arginini]|nr:Uncharacterised protein [Chlamydia abortus]SGA07177.1 Uncharacterised protein [Mycoplasmopsis arginini]SGA09803.1 Uncharacterised protein [Mycoplasmopsis arginini]SGA32095.1 Uncharacterised protein [Chlamydia abortus]